MRNPVKLGDIIAKGMFVPVCVILALQAAASHALSLPERDLPSPEIRKLPLELGNWRAAGEQTLERRVTEFLKPDEYVLRDYVDRTNGSSVNLFVAYFKSLQNNYGPHSPRVCLPGVGWLAVSSNIVTVPAPGRPRGIPVNEYLLEKSGDRMLVVYWYQNDRAIWAEEFQQKLKLLPDLIRYRRSDVSLIRLTTPVLGVADDNEFAMCVKFTQLIFPFLAERFSSGG